MISCFYEAPPSEIHDGLWLVRWPSVLWLAKPPNAVQKRHAPHLRMCSACIVKSDVVNIAYQFEPEWDAENISEEEARLLMLCFFVCCCVILLYMLLFMLLLLLALIIQFYPD